MKQRRILLLLIASCFAHVTGGIKANEPDLVPDSLITQRFIDCHRGDDAEGEMDLAALLELTAAHGPSDPIPGSVAAKWVKVQKAILQKRMPPVGEEELEEKQREALLPEFYYRLETSQGKTLPYAVSDLELATRLSYFLTCPTPDGDLLAAAEAGNLREREILQQQVTRLLNHPRRISLSEHENIQSDPCIADTWPVIGGTSI